MPIVVGGTGLYLRWLVGGKPATPPSDPEAAAAAKAAVKAAAEAEIKRVEEAAAAKGRGTGTGRTGEGSGNGRAGDGDGDRDRDRADGAAANTNTNTGWRGAVKLLSDSGDPETAARLAENDWYRVERAFEIVTATGRPVGDFRPTPPPH